ncbi:MAG: hypothetical protein ACXWFB_12560 [Nitrososphaeraceae archaeon]
MTENKNTIKINPNKPSVLEFDVTVSGLEDSSPVVRFVIHNIKDDIDWVFPCTKLEDSKWQVSFPIFTDTMTKNKFSVEVIVDEYYFKPAYGEIVFIGGASVDVIQKNKENKPSVTTSFSVKQEESTKESTENLIVPKEDTIPVFVAEQPENQSLLFKQLNQEILSSQKGQLFKRDHTGKIIIPGLENSRQREEMVEKERRLKDILHGESE